MTRHVELIHISDVHFGESHRFSPEMTPDGAAAAESEYPTLSDCLLRDLLDETNGPPRPHLGASGHGDGRGWDVPLMPKLLCLTGDFAQAATKKEFAQAIDFVKRISGKPPTGLDLGEDKIFVCPGNHDLDYNAVDVGLRWSEYTAFLNGIYTRKFDSKDAVHFGGVSVCDEVGVLVLSLNSEMAVHNQPKDKTRGDLSQAQLLWARSQLDQIPEDRRRKYIKVAIVHHHPILLPTLAESGRGYDAINGAQHLLTMLHKYGFHVLLHGHKHYPHTFHENVRNAFERTDQHSLVVVAGGSSGSRALPEKQSATQTYNRIRIHWDSKQGTTRVQVVTRGLVRHDAEGRELLAQEWYWQTLATDDRSHLLAGRARSITPSAMRYEISAPKGDPEHQPREDEYRRTRGNFPAAELRPSLLPRQTNEVLLRIVPHIYPGYSQDPTKDLIAVTWSAGYKFPKVRITRNEDPEFCAVFAYYGGALMCGKLEFADSHSCHVYIYAPMLPAEAAAPGPGGGPER
jgi:3',5'-cyclic AMP phosphodiesterase CpdA